MKRFMSMLLLCVMLSVTVNAQADESLDSEKKAIDLFLGLQKEGGSNAEVNAELANIRKSRATEVGETKAIVLGGGCGFAGCDYYYMVSTPYSTKGANPQTRSLLGVVKAGTTLEASLVKVLRSSNLKKILE